MSNHGKTMGKYTINGGMVNHDFQWVNPGKPSINGPSIPVVPHKAVAEVSKIGNL